MEIFDLFFRFIDILEDFKPRAYQCQAGKWTAGYGTTAGITKDTICTKEQAIAWLKRDTAPLLRMTEDIKNPFERVALMLFGYNCGADDLERILQGLLVIKPEGFFTKDGIRFGVMAAGKVSNGLMKRRLLESALVMVARGTK